MTNTNIVRDEKGRIRSKAQQEASRLLFGDPLYMPRCPDKEFQLGSEQITYYDLVRRLRRDFAK